MFWAIDFLSWSWSVPKQKHTGEDMEVYIVNTSNYGRTEECLWRRMAPILVLWREVDVGQVAGDTCHGDRAFAPSLAKVKIERVVFDELVPGIVLSHSRSALGFFRGKGMDILWCGNHRREFQQRPWRWRASQPHIAPSLRRFLGV